MIRNPLKSSLSENMRPELLSLYIRNHRDSLYFALFIAGLFFIVRVYFYGYDSTNEVFLHVFLLGMSGYFFFERRQLYTKLIRQTSPGKDECGPIVLKIAFVKAGYIIPWLLFLFWPLQANYLYDHLVGYLFVFCSIALYSSTSAVFFPLFLIDLGLQVIFTIIVTALNFDVQETSYVGGMILIFAAYSVYIGRKMNQSTVKLFESKDNLEKAVRRIDHAHRAKSDFLAVMSHEIRTPMNGILSVSDFLRDTKLTKEQIGYLDVIKQCSASLLRTLNDVLDISKIEAGKLPIENIDFDLHAVLNNSVYVASPVAKEKSIETAIKIDPSVPQRANGDPNRLQQIIVNLFNNAIKFTDNGSVTLRATLIDQNLHIEVQDTGIGISREKQKKLFRKFSQTDASVAREYGGTGLGLFIVQNLVQLMGGQMNVQSAEGKGSTFWFDIPYREASSQEDRHEEEDIPQERSGLRILLADDNQTNQMIVAKLLQNRGHDIKIVHNGMQALNYLKTSDFDIILMDLNMPGMNGLETTAAIKKLGPKYKAIPVIALTASVMEDQIKACYKAGMIGHIAKPIERHEFFRVLAKHAPQLADEQGKAYQDSTQDKEDPMIAQIEAIREEFGDDFLKPFITDNLEEVDRLLNCAKTDLEKKVYKDFRDNIHDLITVSGNIGMSVLSSQCRSAEKLCTQENFDALPKVFNDLLKVFETERQQLEKIAGLG